MGQGVRDALKMSVPVRVETISDQRVVRIDLRDVPLSDWCLGLCLLKEELVGEVLLTGGVRLRIVRHGRLKPPARATLDFTSEPAELAVGPTELDYWVSFFLQYYRDGVAQVDHLDVEAHITPGKREQAYVILRVKDAAAPVSAEEARKRLGLG